MPATPAPCDPTTANTQRDPISSGYTATADRSPAAPRAMVVARSAIESPKPRRPMRMTARRPQTSLFRPHPGLRSTQMLAEVAKMAESRNGELPSARGGRLDREQHRLPEADADEADEEKRSEE